MPPGSPGVEPIPDDLRLTAEQTAVLGRQLWDECRPFAAHEVFEAAWKQAVDDDDRRRWRGLAQLMVAATHAMRGNAAGATALFARSDETLAPVTSTPAVDLDEWRELTRPLRPHVGEQDR